MTPEYSILKERIDMLEQQFHVVVENQAIIMSYLEDAVKNQLKKERDIDE